MSALRRTQTKQKCCLWSKAVGIWVFWTQTTTTVRWATPTVWKAAKRSATTVFRKETLTWRIILRRPPKPSSRTAVRIDRKASSLSSGRRCYRPSTRNKRAFIRNSSSRRWRRRQELQMLPTPRCTTTTAAVTVKRCRRPRYKRQIQIWTRVPSLHNSNSS